MENQGITMDNELIGKKVSCIGYLIPNQNRYEIKIRNICEADKESEFLNELPNYDFWVYDSISKEYLYRMNGLYSDFFTEEYSIKFEKVEGVVESIEDVIIASSALLVENSYEANKICFNHLVANVMVGNTKKQVPLSCVEQSSIYDKG